MHTPSSKVLPNFVWQKSDEHPFDLVLNILLVKATWAKDEA